MPFNIPEPDATRRPYSTARRAPQWQRLITSVHNAQAAAGYAGRQWGAGEIRFFNAEAVGMPAEYVARDRDPLKFRAYWVERQTFEHIDGAQTVTYALKMVRGDNLANVHTIDTEAAYAPDAEWEEGAARAMVKRAHSQSREA